MFTFSIHMYHSCFGPFSVKVFSSDATHWVELQGGNRQEGIIYLRTRDSALEVGRALAKAAGVILGGDVEPEVVPAEEHPSDVSF